MSASSNLKRLGVVFETIALIGLSLVASSVAAGMDRPSSDERPRVVVIDPGHGGHDSGARGTENILEKQVVMKFSRILRDALKNKYTVFLTRNDDYDIPFEDRIAVANHARADLLLSIHTGGSLLHNLGGMNLFYYETPPGTEPQAASATSASNPTGRLEAWDTHKAAYIEYSKYFAQLTRMRLLGDRKDSRISIAGAPLFIAVGADMPTLLIEIGYVTHPGDAQLLNDPDILIGYARSILKAIDDLFSDKLRL